MNANPGIPHNLLAEQAYIAHVLIDPERTLNNTSIELKPEDFFDTRHQLIYETAEILHNNYRTVNPIEVVSALKNAGQLGDAGGIQYIMQAINPANITSYGTNPVGLALLIKEEKQRRDLLDASYRITQAASTGSGVDSDEALALAETEVFSLINSQTKDSNYEFTIKGLAGEVIESIRSLSEAPEGSTPYGVPTGFDALDNLTTGFKGGQLIIIAARPGIGKALDITTPILTTKGIKLLSDITDKDCIYGMNGKPYKIVKAHEPFLSTDSYKVSFSDGSHKIVNAKHLWLTETRQARKNAKNSGNRKKMFTDAQLAMLQNELTNTDPTEIATIAQISTVIGLSHTSRLKKLIELCSQLEYQSAKIQSTAMKNVNTYKLSDVAQHFQNSKTIQEASNNAVYTKIVNSVHSSQSKAMTVKELTETIFGGTATAANSAYIRNLLNRENVTSQSQTCTETASRHKTVLSYNKVELIEAFLKYGHSYRNDQRTLNSVASVKSTKQIFDTLKTDSNSRSNHSVQIADPISALHWKGRTLTTEERIERLNKISSNSKLTTKDETLAKEVTLFASSLGFKTLQKKINDDFIVSWSAHSDKKYIIDVTPVKNVMMRCLTVDSPNSMFLVGNELTPTHNSTLAVDFARSATFLDGKTVVFFSLEMDQKELTTRVLSAEGRVETTKLKKGTLDEIDWMNISEAQEKITKGNFILLTNPDVNISKIRATCMKQKMQPEGLDMVIIDYLQLIEMNNHIPREQAVSEASRSLKILAKELEVPIIILSQLNRKSEDRQDGKPSVSDLRESGSLEQDADIVLLLHRPEANDPNNRPGQTDLIIGKHRGGPTGVVQLTSMLQFSKFVPGTGLIEREDEFEDNTPGLVIAEEAPW